MSENDNAEKSKANLNPNRIGKRKGVSNKAVYKNFTKPDPDIKIDYYDKIIKRAHKLSHVSMRGRSKLTARLTPFQYAFLMCEEERIGISRQELFRRIFDFYMYGAVLGEDIRGFVEWGYIKKAFITQRFNKENKDGEAVDDIILDYNEINPMLDEEIERELSEDLHVLKNTKEREKRIKDGKSIRGDI